jgi:hypothetical protein
LKRILLLDHPQYTSATFYLWHGLKELEALYPDQISVSCYPFIPTNYDEMAYDYTALEWFPRLSQFVEDCKTGKEKFPYGIPAFQPDEYLTAQKQSYIKKPFPWSSFKKENVLETEEQAVQQLKDNEFDLIILGNSHRVPTILLSRLKERINSLPPIVYFDAGERDELNEHWIHVFKPALTFKQILTPEVRAKGMSVKPGGYTFKIYPLPLSSPLVDKETTIDGVDLQWLREYSKVNPKFLQVFYSMSNTWEAREAVTKELDQLMIRRDLSRVKGCHYPAYHYLLAHSRMGVTMRGSGRDTTRYWEIPLYKTAMISDGTMGCIHPYPFEDGKTAIFYHSLAELITLVNDRVDVASDVEKIATAGQEHLKKYHSTTGRIVFFLDILHKELNFCDRRLLLSLAEWKGKRQWEDRPWEGPVV